MSAWQRFAIGTPFIGPEVRLIREIREQLEQRTVDCTTVWDERFTAREAAIARKVSEIIRKQNSWPNAYYIPEDSVVLLLVSPSPEDAIAEIEATYSFKWHTLPSPLAFAEESANLGELVSVIANLPVR